MANQDVALMAHLMRRAAFGASRDEIEARAAQGYDKTAEEFLAPKDQPGIEEDQWRPKQRPHRPRSVCEKTTCLDT